MLRKALASLLLAFGLLVSPATATWNPGVYTLASVAITAPLTASVQTPIVNLEGLTGVTLDVAFGYGSGGTTAVVVVQTSSDGGTIWRDVAYFAFTTASASKYANLSGLTPKSVAAYAALAMDGVNDGLLGDQLRAVITTTGTYVGTTLAVRASVR